MHSHNARSTRSQRLHITLAPRAHTAQSLHALARPSPSRSARSTRSHNSYLSPHFLFHTCFTPFSPHLLLATPPRSPPQRSHHAHTTLEPHARTALAARACIMLTPRAHTSLHRTPSRAHDARTTRSYRAHPRPVLALALVVVLLFSRPAEAGAAAAAGGMPLAVSFHFSLPSSPVPPLIHLAVV
jgi:hypothetical protein